MTPPKNSSLFSKIYVLLCPWFFFSFISGQFSFAYAATAKQETHKFKQHEKKSFDEKYEEFLKTSLKYQNFSAQFKQEFYSVLRDKVTESAGTLSIQKPSSFRFEVTEPRAEIYVANKTDFWKYIPELKHAQHLRTTLSELNFLRILVDPSHLKQFYDVSPWEGDEAAVLKQTADTPFVLSDAPPHSQAGTGGPELLNLKLLPKGDKQQKILYAVVQVKTGFIQELRIVQLNGNRTRLVFSNYNSAPISPKTFEFTPPQGIVVDNPS